MRKMAPVCLFVIVRGGYLCSCQVSYSLFLVGNKTKATLGLYHYFKIYIFNNNVVFIWGGGGALHSILSKGLSPNKICLNPSPTHSNNVYSMTHGKN